MKKRLLRAYARWVIRHRYGIIAGAFVLSLASVLISVFFLKTQTGILDLYSKDSEVNRRFLSYIEKFGAAENLIVVFEGQDDTKVREAMDALAARLKPDPFHYLDSLFYKVDLKIFESHAFQFLSENQAADMLRQATRTDGAIRRLFAAQNLEQFLDSMNDSVERGLASSPTIQGAEAQDFKKLLQPILLLRDSLEGQALSEASVIAALSEASQERSTFDDAGYLRTDDKKFHIMFVKPEDRRQDYKIAQELVKWTRKEIRDLQPQFPGVTLGLTGGPALNNDQFEISKKDMTLASIFAYISTGVLFILAFRSFGRPLLGLLTLSLSMTCVFGLTTLTIGHLNIFSMAFIVILVGEGTYYGVHVVARYEEELIRGLAPPKAMEETLVHVVGNVTTSTLTTSVVFFATVLVPLKGFAELGWIAGTGVMVSSLFMQMLLPAFLMAYDGKGVRGTLEPKKIPILHKTALTTRWVSFASALFKRRSGLIIGLVVAASLWGAYRFYSPDYGVHFDNNLLNLQAKNTEAVRYEKKLIETSLSPRAAVFMAASAEEAEQLAERARKLPTVQRVEWLGSVFPEGKSSAATDRALQEAILRLPASPLVSVQAQAVAKELQRLRDNLEKIQNLALSSPQGEQVLPAAEQGIATIDVILKKFPDSKLDAGTRSVLEAEFIAPQLNRFQEVFLPALRNMLEQAARSKPMTLQDLPKDLVSPLLAPDGTYAVYAFPSVNIWERAPLENFIAELKTVSPELTGSPMMFYEILNLVRNSYFRAAGLSALAIFILFLIDFRSLRYSLLASLPLVFGVFILFGLMSWLKLSFNTANMIALPMILGIGADNGVHLIHRFIEEKERDISFLFRSTGKAVLVTYIDSTTSFLGLVFANHQGLAQLGQVVVLGITTCTICGILFLPAVMTLLIRRRARQQRAAA